jgi:hypothetical protein
MALRFGWIGLSWVVGCASGSEMAASPPDADGGAGARAVDASVHPTSADAAAPPEDTAPEVPSCSEYCDAIMPCNPDLHEEYPDEDLCLRECALFPKGTVGDMGNTLGCRLAHARAVPGSPETECVAAGPTGGGVCGTRCEAFCLLAIAVCGDLWDGGCAAACAQWATVNGGPLGEPSGDTLDCREAEVQSAFEAQAPDGSSGCPSVGSVSAECR